MDAARERTRLEQLEAEKHLDLHLSGMSRLTGIDFSKFDLDQPLPDTLTTNGHQSALAKWIGQTPRSILQSYARKGGIDYTGTPDHVAGMMQEIMEEVGGDGFLIFNSYFDRRYVIEVCDGLVPELQRRGVTRKAYAHRHLKDNLLEF
jgi:alkanesulfonate monooxygenase SsuD/methylene tetrahydromethanopterin reductase-like flavin-dependent oxidoreductase (luciferase family)